MNRWTTGARTLSSTRWCIAVCESVPSTSVRAASPLRVARAVPAVEEHERGLGALARGGVHARVQRIDAARDHVHRRRAHAVGDRGVPPPGLRVRNRQQDGLRAQLLLQLIERQRVVVGVAERLDRLVRRPRRPAVEADHQREGALLGPRPPPRAARERQQQAQREERTSRVLHGATTSSSSTRASVSAGARPASASRATGPRLKIT